MPRFRLDSLAQLARQLEFAPHDVRLRQLAAAEDLLHLLDPAKAYPLDFVIYKITEYRSKEAQSDLLTGLALQHDLGLLVEHVSRSLNLNTAEISEPVLCIDDVCERFNVTSKTIQRWRRKGLVARRFIFPDGKRRVGFLLGSVERFIANHERDVAAANLSQVESGELATIVRHARRLAADCNCTSDQLTRRVAAITRRSPLTILHTLRKHDQEQPNEAVLRMASPNLPDIAREVILEAFEQGEGVSSIARLLGRSNYCIYRAILDERAAGLLKHRVRFYDDPLYHQADAGDAIDQIVRQEEIAEAPAREDLRVPRDLPPYLRDLYRTPLLSKSKERALFLKLNFHKYQFMHLRRRLDLENLKARDLRQLKTALANTSEAKNRIITANLRLVVSIARKHVRPGVGLLELISEGNMTLMRAVDGFDIHRGHRFSTYATLALMKGFARLVPQILSAAKREAASTDSLNLVADRTAAPAAERLVDREHVRGLLSRLDDRERDVLLAHYGLDESEPATYEQVGRRMGLSKERIRQIEQTALTKLRAVEAKAC